MRDAEFVLDWDVYRDADGNAVTYCREALVPIEPGLGWSFFTCHGCDSSGSEPSSRNSPEDDTGQFS